MIYTVYAKADDITFIMEETKTEAGTKVEVKGFYYGEPTEEFTKQFYGCTVAHFENMED